MDFKSVTLAGFSEAIATKTPTPGGGGAAALAGSVGIALGDMVGEYTVGKERYKAHEDDITKAMLRAQLIRAELLECINEDAIAYNNVSAVYKMDKNDKHRDELMENALIGAAQVPLKMLELIKESMELQLEFMKYGSIMIISDAMSGAYLLNGAAKAAQVNVKINTKSMKDRKFANNVDKKANAAVLECDRLLNEIHNLYHN